MHTSSAPESRLGVHGFYLENRVGDFFYSEPTFVGAKQPANTDGTWDFDLLTENPRRDVFDQLIEVIAPEGTTSYSYDASGNLIEKTDATGTTTYGYDWQDRMISVTTRLHSATYEYDHDGVMVVN